jgi:hypothetical protein
LLADVNGDGVLDLLVGNSDATVSLLIGNDNGTFQGRLDYPAGAGIAAIAVADLTRDGRPDVVVSAALSNTVRVLRATCLR